MKPKWDYLFIVHDNGRPRYLNGQEIPDWQQGPALFEVVNYLYRKGWELVDSPASFGLRYPIIDFPKFSMTFRRTKKQ